MYHDAGIKMLAVYVGQVQEAVQNLSTSKMVRLVRWQADRKG